MGGLTTLASTAIQAIGAANTIIGAVDKAQSGRREIEQTKAANALALKDANEKAALQKENIRVEAEKAEAQRVAALRRTVARQRAQFGASGISQGDGSAQAVLLGQFDESDQDKTLRNTLDTLKAASIDQNLSQIQRANTLELTQLKEKNRLKNFTNALQIFKTDD